MDTTGTWPFGQRPSDQMPSRFAALFLKMGDQQGNCSGKENIENIRNYKSAPSPSLPASEDEKCDLESLNRPSHGAVANRYNGFKTSHPTVPINPMRHEYIDENNQKLVGFDEDQKKGGSDPFPYLRPPNSGPGYYQSVAETDNAKFETQDYADKGTAWSRQDYDAHDPTVGYHPYCIKVDGKWRETKLARDACDTEAHQRFGVSGRFDNTPGAVRSPENARGSAFYVRCQSGMGRWCRGETFNYDY